VVDQAEPGRELSPAERRFWLLDLLNGASRRYTITEGWRLQGLLDIDAMSRSLSLVASRHDVLRTGYRLTPDGPRAFDLASPPVEVVLSDAEGRTTTERVQQARARAVAMERSPFDLERGPLLRAGLVRVSADDHVLILAAHHIVSDGWSTRVLQDEVGRAYRALCHAEEPDLAPAPRYGEAVAERRTRTEGAAGRSLRAYWTRQLDGVPLVNGLPLDRPRPAGHVIAASELSVSIPPAVARELATRAEGFGVTQFVLLLTAFVALARRWTGRPEVVVAVPAACRDADDERTVGCFLNTLPLRVRVPAVATFTELLEVVQGTTLDALAHQDLPFEAIVESLDIRVDLSRNPLVALGFNVLNYAWSPLRLEGLQVKPFHLPRTSALFDVAMYVQEWAGRIGLRLVYDRALFQRAAMRAFLDQFVQLLEVASAQPDETAFRHSLVTARTHAVLPDATSELDSTWVGPVHELFERVAATTPGAPAVVAGGNTWTYADCSLISGILAARLRAAGVRPGQVVAILADRDPRLPVALLATSRAGAAFLVLDTSHPAERLCRLLSQTEVAALVLAAETTSAGTREVLSRWTALRPGRPPLALPAACAVAADLPAVAVGPDDLAYVAYTSGSTGHPRGVRGRHGSLTHFMPWLQDAFGLSAADRFSMLAGLGHDPLHREVFTPLAIGASVHVPPPDVAGSPDRLARWILGSGVTVVHVTPGLLRMLAGGVAGLGCGRTSLRLAFCVGDVLSWHDVRSFRRISAPGGGVVALYGTTETQRAVAWALPGWQGPGSSVVREPRGGHGAVPLGWGIPDVQLLVLNQVDVQAGVGELGEIAVRSPHLALGYLDEPDATAERFTANPVATDSRDRVYRTGDLGRYRPDGAVEFAGRRDRQVQVQGFRVEPSEVEAAIREHPSVRDVIVLPDTGLSAYVVPRTLGSLAALTAFLRARLPGPLVPGRILEVPAIPLTPNGKVDEEALRQLPVRALDGAGPSDGAVRRTLELLWREVAGAETEFGTSSLALLRLHVRLEEVLGRRIDVVELFRHRDLDALAGSMADGAYRRTSR